MTLSHGLFAVGTVCAVQFIRATTGWPIPPGIGVISAIILTRVLARYGL